MSQPGDVVVGKSEDGVMGSESSIVSAVVGPNTPAAKKFGTRQMMRAVRRMKDLLEQTESNLSMTSEEKRALEIELEEAREEVLKLKDEYDAARAAGKAVFQAALATEIDAAQKACDDLRAVAHKAEADKQAVEQELNARNDELAEANDILYTIQQELNNLKDQTEKLSEEQRRTSQAKEMMKDALEHKIETLKDECAGKEATIAGLLRYKVEAESRSTAASEELRALEKENIAISAVNEEMKRERNELTLALDKLQHKLDAATAEQCERHARALADLEASHDRKEKDLLEKQATFEKRVEEKYKALYDEKCHQLEEMEKDHAARVEKLRAEADAAKMEAEQATVAAKKEVKAAKEEVAKHQQKRATAPPPFEQRYVRDFTAQLMDAYAQSMDSRNRDAECMQGLAAAQKASQSAFDKFADAYGTLASIGKMHAEATANWNARLQNITPKKKSSAQ